LQDLIGTLEQRVADRTLALQTSTEVSRRLSTILDPSQLMLEVVEQLKSAFGYYHAHIYLFDPTQEYLVMKGGTGEAGRIMLARGHKIPRGRGLVGRAAELNAPVFVPDVSKDMNWLPNPLLPETKAEVAVPISVGDQVLGVLDVQHNVLGVLKEESVALIQGIASQVAIALQNAEAYERAQRRAHREALLAELSGKIQSAATIEDVLKTAVEGLGQALKARRSGVELGLRRPPQVVGELNNKLTQEEGGDGSGSS
jgi:GAF domain-containing protein